MGDRHFPADPAWLAAGTIGAAASAHDTYFDQQVATAVARILDVALEGLPADQRCALEMVVVGRCTYAELADELGTNRKQAWRVVRYAVAAVRSRLEATPWMLALLGHPVDLTEEPDRQLSLDLEMQAPARPWLTQ